jgi:anti-anti-sigma factor
MPIRYLKNKNVLILYPSGRFDLEQSRHIDQELQNLASTESSSNFLLNMEGVDYVNSYGLKVIVNTYRNFKMRVRFICVM